MLKKKKIADYLNTQSNGSIFDELLRLYENNSLKSRLQDWGLKRISIYVDWKSDYKCLDVQAKYKDYYYEWQFIEDECEYMIYVDGDEPEEANCLKYSEVGSIDDLLLKMKTLLPVSN